ncbi:response regulator transcription factor [Belliella sp. R4-6]|uniref:Response regulator transcription factor n=1 Tax=Belliella alkalica TaxID=1730871 RepID=A0ABS9V8S3_9BACT|nr:response regulator transcription factor [Belliella alkalica]MCH7412821.1 response regulator transcription factor [Belliella alkalica]
MSIFIKCLIVDDEPFAQEVIEKHAEKVPYLQVVKKSNNAVEALKDIEEYLPDLVFMDIQMPEMSGLELIKILNNHKPKVIITTAFPEHALEGFDLDVSDYLLKPISFERFLKAVNKVYTYQKLATQPRIPAVQSSESDSPTFFWVKENGKLVHVAFEDVQMIKGMKDYLQIFLKERRIITYMTMKRIMEILPLQDFMRVSRSYIVRKSSIISINGNMLETSLGEEVMIGTTYRDIIRDEVNEWLK